MGSYISFAISILFILFTEIFSMFFLILTAPVYSFRTQRCSHTFPIHLWLGIELSQVSAELLPGVPSKAYNMFPCSKGLSIASFRTCWSWSLHETKYCPENDAKSPFAVPHTLSVRAVLRLWQFSSLCDSTAQASVQEPCSYWCVMDCHCSQAGIFY